MNFQPNSNRYRFKLKGFEKRTQIRSDNTSPNNYEKENNNEKMKNTMHNFGDMFQNFAATFQKMSKTMQKMEAKLNKIENYQVAKTDLQQNAHTKSDLKNHKGDLNNINSIMKCQNRNSVNTQYYSPTNMLNTNLFEPYNLQNKNIVQIDNLQIEQRFQLIKINYPKLLEYEVGSEQKMDQIFDWLSKTCKKVFSATFKQLLSGHLNNKAAKTYCSQNLLYHLIQLIRKNNLKNIQVAKINQFLKDTLLPYFQLKYPQSETNQVNLRLSNKIEKIDNYNSNRNDLVYQSNTQFQYDEQGTYNTPIMQVLNYVIDLADIHIHQNQPNKEQIEIIQDDKKAKDKENRQKKKPQKKNHQDRAEEQTLFTSFFNDMESLFKKVQDEDQVLRMKKGLSQQQFKKEFSNIYENKKDPAKKQIYKQKVKSYTKYLIGRKISESVDQYDHQDLKAGHLFVQNAQVLRILNKWCTHLRQKFINTERFIEDRQEPFRMQDGSQGYLSKTHRIILSKMLKNEEENIKIYLQKVLANNYGFQQYSAKKQLPKKMKWFSEQQSTVGIFTATLFSNNENYIIGYLNILIHSLLKVTNLFNDVINLQRHKNPKKRDKTEKNMHKLCINKITTQKFIQFIESTKSNQQNFNYQSVPQLVTFRIGDLMRCKCSSKQKQITAIYKQIMRISNSSSLIWKINRIKNRLTQGTRDILINLVYMDKIVVEVQLQVDQAKSHFIVCSSSFKHYLYQLSRAQFGPLSQMASIWMNHDSRGQFYRQQLKQMNIRREQDNPQHLCTSNSQALDSDDPIFALQKFPFVCSICNKLWTDTYFAEAHIHCNICLKHICGYCQINIDNQILAPNFRASLTDIISEDKIFKDEKQDIPDFGACLNLYAKETMVLRYRKIYYEYKTYIFQEYVGPNGQNQYYFICDITNKKQKQEFQQKYYILSLQEETYKNYSGSLQNKKNKKDQENILIAQNYFLPKYFQLIMQQKKNSILQQGKRINNKTFEIMSVCEDVTKVNFSQNDISDFQRIMQKFPSLDIAVLAQNDFTSLPQSINILANTITYLDLNSNDITQLPKTFIDLKHLKYLNLSRNQLKILPQNFTNLSELKDLIIGYNQLSTWRYLPDSLKRLDLQHNKFSDSINIQRLKKLAFINLAFNKLQSIQGLSNTKTLKTLDLSNNSIHRHKFHNLYSLQNLLLPFNSIQQILITYDHPQNSKLKHLNMSHNKLRKLPKDFFKNIHTIECLSLAENKLQYISQQIFCLQNIEQLNLSAIRTMKFKRKKNKDHHPTMTKKVSVQSQNNQQIQVPYDILPPDTHLHLHNLTYLYMSNNKLPQIPETLSKMIQLKQLDLSSNRIKKIDMILTANSVNLRTNKIEQFNQSTAHYLNTIQTLYIKNNPCSKNINSSMIKSIMKNLLTFDLSESTGSQSSMGSIRSKKSHKSMNNCSDSSEQNSENSIEQKMRNDIDQDTGQNGQGIQNNENKQNQPKNIIPRKINHLNHRIPSGLGKRKKMNEIQQIIKEQAQNEQKEFNQDEF